MEQAESPEVGRKKTVVPDEKNENNTIKEGIPDPSGEDGGGESSPEETKVFLEDLKVSLEEMKNKGREDTPEAARLKERIKEIEDPIQDEESENSLEDMKAFLEDLELKGRGDTPNAAILRSEIKKQEKVEEEIPSLWRKSNSAKSLKNEEEELSKLTKDQEKEDAKRLKLARENVERLTSNIPEGEKGSKKEPASGDKKKKETKTGDPESLKLATMLTGEVEMLNGVLSRKKGEAVSPEEAAVLRKYALNGKDSIKIRHKSMELERWKDLALGSTLTYKSVEAVSFGDNDIEKLIKVARLSQESVKTLAAAMEMELSAEQVSGGKRGAVNKLIKNLSNRFDRNKGGNDTGVLNEYKLTGGQADILWKIRNRNEKNNKRAFETLVYKTGRSDYQEIIKAKDFKYEEPKLTNGKIEFGATWTDEDGNPKNLHFVIDEKNHKPTIWSSGDFRHKYPVEIVTMEDDTVSQLDAESAKEIKKNYPKTAEFFKQFRTICSDDREGLLEINEAEDCLKDGEKEKARSIIEAQVLQIQKGLNAGAWNQKETKNANALKDMASAAVDELKKEETAGNEQQEWEKRKEELIIKYPELEKITTYDQSQTKAEKIRYLRDTILESLSEEQLVDMDKRLEKNNTYFSVDFQGGELIYDDAAESKFLNKITAGRWEAGNVNDVEAIKKIIGEKFSAINIFGNHVKDFIKNKSENGSGSEDEAEEEGENDKNETGSGKGQTRQDSGEEDNKDGEGGIEIDKEISAKYPKTTSFLRLLEKTGGNNKTVTGKASEILEFLNKWDGSQAKAAIEKYTTLAEEAFVKGFFPGVNQQEMDDLLKAAGEAVEELSKKGTRGRAENKGKEDREPIEILKFEEMAEGKRYIVSADGENFEVWRSKGGMVVKGSNGVPVTTGGFTIEVGKPLHGSYLNVNVDSIKPKQLKESSTKKGTGETEEPLKPETPQRTRKESKEKRVPHELKDEDIEEGDAYKIYTDKGTFTVRRKGNKLGLDIEGEIVAQNTLDKSFSIEVGKRAKVLLQFKGLTKGNYLDWDIKRIENVR